MTNLQIYRSDDKSYHVLVDGQISSHLALDECMGCVASALFRDKPMHAYPLQQWMRETTYHSGDEKLKILQGLGLMLPRNVCPLCKDNDEQRPPCELCGRSVVALDIPF